jgi:hypothetical protein
MSTECRDRLQKLLKCYKLQGLRNRGRSKWLLDDDDDDDNDGGGGGGGVFIGGSNWAHKTIVLPLQLPSNSLLLLTKIIFINHPSFCLSEFFHAFTAFRSQFSYWSNNDSRIFWIHVNKTGYQFTNLISSVSLVLFINRSWCQLPFKILVISVSLFWWENKPTQPAGTTHKRPYFCETQQLQKSPHCRSGSIIW